MNGLISRAAAVDALTDTNLKRNFDSVCDGDMNRTRRAAQRIIAQLPAVDAIPVEWLNERHRRCCEEADTDLMDAITVLCNEYHVWQREQEPDL